MTRLWRVWAAAVLLAAFVAPAAQRDSKATDALFARIDDLMAQISDITGLEVRRRVAHALIPRSRLKEFLEERIREEIEPDQIRVEELLLKKLGFAPKDFRLKETMVALYEEQAAALYDFRKKKLFLLDSGGGPMQEAALVHELAHALADQHFRLQRFLDKAGKNDDGALARMAVMEGQATWIMMEFSARRIGQSLTESPEMVDLMSRLTGASSGEFPVLDRVPLYIRQSLVFPYASGLKFQQAVFEKLGKRAFREVFRRPPRSTRQVLHPEKYFRPDEREPPRLPRIGGGYKKSAEGVLGEFDFAVLLQQYGDEGLVRRLAPKWRAGKYQLWESKHRRRSVLLHASVWATDEAARRFFNFYRRVLVGKWEDVSFSADTPERYAGTGGDGEFVVRLAGDVVYAVEGVRSLGEIRRWPQPKRRADRRPSVELYLIPRRLWEPGGDSPAETHPVVPAAGPPWTAEFFGGLPLK